MEMKHFLSPMLQEPLELLSIAVLQALGQDF